MSPAMVVAADQWIRQRLGSRGVYEEGGQWIANLRGTVVGSYATQKEALMAYKKAARDKFREAAALPTDDDMEQVLASGPITLQATAQPATQPAKPPPAAPSKVEPKQAPKPAAKPTSHRR